MVKMAEVESMDRSVSRCLAPPPTTPLQKAGSKTSWAALTGGNVFSFLDAVRKCRSPRSIEALRDELASKHNIKYTASDALRFSIMYGHQQYAQHLLRTDVEASLSKSVCCPLLLLAVRLERPICVEALCRYSRDLKDHGQYVDVRGCSTMERGRTALHTATETGNVQCTRILLRYGADTQAQDDSGCTPLVRLLYMLQPVHLNCRVITCALELIHCEAALQKAHANVLHKAMQHVAYTGPSPSAGPFALSHMCRSVIRKAVGYPRLPEGLSELGLPKSMQKYLDISV